MDTNSTASGLVIGAMLVGVGIVGSLIWQLCQSPSEAARRGRWVLGGLLTLIAAAYVVAGTGFIGLAVVAGVIGAIVWIVRAI